MGIMVRTIPSHGLCPGCGRDVARTLNLHAGVTTETYHCPIDGDRSYGPHGIPVQDWAAPSMLSIRSTLGVPGIDWV